MAGPTYKKLSPLHLAVLDVLHASDDKGLTHGDLRAAAPPIGAKIGKDPKLAKADVLSVIGELCLPAPIALVEKVMDGDTGEPIGGSVTRDHRFRLTDAARTQLPGIFKTYKLVPTPPKAGAKVAPPPPSRDKQAELASA